MWVARRWVQWLPVSPIGSRTLAIWHIWGAAYAPAIGSPRTAHTPYAAGATESLEHAANARAAPASASVTAAARRVRRAGTVRTAIGLSPRVRRGRSRPQRCSYPVAPRAVQRPAGTWYGPAR